jgi:hypothetical protein
MEIDMSRMKDFAFELEAYTTSAIQHTALILAGTHPDNQQATKMLDEALKFLQQRMTDVEYKDFMFDVDRIMDKYQHRW